MKIIERNILLFELSIHDFHLWSLGKCIQASSTCGHWGKKWASKNIDQLHWSFVFGSWIPKLGRERCGFQVIYPNISILFITCHNACSEKSESMLK